MSNYTQLGLVKQTDGENTGTWGDKLNDSLIDLLDDAIGGYVEVNVASGNVTLAFADGTADNNGRHATIKFTGSPGTTRTVTFPDAQVNYFITNGSDGSVICTSGSGAATVTIPTGMKDIIYVDGSDEVLSMFGTPHLSSSGNFTVDATTDIILDADGGDIFFKDGGTTFGSATNTSGNLIIKSGTTTAATFSGANVTLAGTVGSGAVTSTGVVTGTGFTIGSAVINEAELETIDGITAGTVIASKALVVDSNKDIATLRNITLSGELDAGSLDVSGDADIDGTMEADAYTVAGTTLSEYIADTSGAMFSSNTETGITATYQDGDNTVDLAIDAAQTTITSLLATDIKIGEDDQTKVDFETADEIHFYAANAHQVKLIDGALLPASDNDIDLGSASLEFKDAYFDGTVEADAITIGGTAVTAGGASKGFAIAVAIAL